MPIIFVVDGHQMMRANLLTQQIQSFLSLSTSNKIGYDLFVSISS